MKPAIPTSPPNGLSELWLPASVYGSVGLALFAAAAWRGESPWGVSLQILIGFGLWTFLEYWLHRLVLHMIPRGPVRRYLSGRHILHHRNPIGHPGIVVLWVSLTVAAGVATLFLVLFGLGAACALMTGIVTGYLCYEYTHLAMHVERRPLTPWGDRLRCHHRLHHERSARHNFAILIPLWDWLFRTRLPAGARAIVR